ncbi:hypothetical protein KSP40_PGU017588 [Platanthera guangdongensis]|uniref:Uncharacterized protein n=1 Tax=Platanthera guangdongensis TaxID=2320717 RepID=A0ABR2LDG5_9ASPA
MGISIQLHRTLSPLFPAPPSSALFIRTLASIRYPLHFLSAQSWLREPSITARSLSSESLPTLPSQSRGGLPRFHSQILPTSKAFRLPLSFSISLTLSMFSSFANYCNADCLPSNSSIVMQGEVVRVEGDEFWHMTKVLRLSLSDRFLTSSPLLHLAV